MSREPRPPDDVCYEERTPWVRQGDLFCGVPVGYGLLFSHAVEVRSPATWRYDIGPVVARFPSG